MINRERSSKTLSTPPFIKGHNDFLGGNFETLHLDRRSLINDFDNEDNQLSMTAPAPSNIKVSHNGFWNETFLGNSIR